MHTNKKNFCRSTSKDTNFNVIDYNDIIVVDGHMHINSGNCAPLPLIWDKVPAIANLIIKIKEQKRSVIDKTLDSSLIVKWFQKGVYNTNKIQNKTTYQIGNVAVKENKKAFKAISNLMTFMIIMPMDMEFAHIDGYYGYPIYNKVYTRKYYIKKEYCRHMGQGPSVEMERKVIIWPKEVIGDLPKDADVSEVVNVDTKTEKGPFYYFFIRDSGNDKENITERVPVWLDAEEYRMFEFWEKQVINTKKTTVKKPWQFLPMYHFEPRRWNNNKLYVKSKDSKGVELYPKGWDIPFNEIVTPGREGLFIGFKMYTALGYRPFDERLPYLYDFYDRCTKEKIPVICHCSDGGMTTHEKKYYLENYIEFLDIRGFEKEKERIEGKYTRWWILPDKPGQFFNDKFVKPIAWEEVFKKFKELKLCLAHFGGGDSEWKTWRENTKWRCDNYDEGSWFSPPPDETKAKYIESWFNDESVWIKKIVNLMENTKYKNFYTDISYHFLDKHKDEFLWLIDKYPKIKKKIIFGTDWYMTEIDEKDYPTYIREAKKAIDNLSKSRKISEDLWRLFAFENPFRFYGFHLIADNFAKALKKNARREKNASKLTKKIEKGLEIIKKVTIPES